MPGNRISLSQKARQHVLRLVREHNTKDLEFLACATGYDKQDIKAVLVAQVDRPPKPLPDSVPRFIEEVEANTGLQCRKIKAMSDGTSEWLLLGPNNIALMLLFGAKDMLQGTQAMGPAHIQGISSTQRNARASKKKLAPEDQAE